MSCCSESVICRQREVLYAALCEDEGIQSTGICRGQQSPLNINSFGGFKETCHTFAAECMWPPASNAAAKTMVL